MRIRRLKAVAALTAAAVLLAGCQTDKKATASILSEGESDLEYVKSKGALVVGITDYTPMDYKEGEEWTGFDAELARVFAESIGVEVEFQEIDWDSKVELLKRGHIDCIWNAMTMTDELMETISCSEPYLSGAQVVVMDADKAQQYSTIEECQHMLFAVEGGSTGEALIKDMNFRYAPYPTQKEALESVCQNKSDAAVVDSVIAGYSIASEEGFETLGYKLVLNDEKICIGFRQGSDLTEAVNEFLTASHEDGTIYEIADKYGIRGEVL